MLSQLTSTGLLSLLLAGSANADVLFATSYNDGTLSTLELKGKSLTVTSSTLDCGQQPTFLTLDWEKKVLYCLDEGWDGTAGISSFKTNPNGKLDTIEYEPVLKSPVASVLYGPNKAGLAVAFYDTSTFGTFNVGNPKDISLIQNETYTLATPGPVPDRQTIPHEHDTVLDPTGKFILVPDLGADLVRIIKIADKGLGWKALTPAKAVSGSGPRHGAFIKQGPNTYFYTLNELSVSITGYAVSYPGGNLSLKQIFDVPVHGKGTTAPAGAAASEIQASPDNRFIIVANRFEYSLQIPNWDPKNSTKIPSDPLLTFSINGRDGSINLVQTAPAGGINPRGFSLNAAGDKLVSALQNDNRVVVYSRDIASGKLGAPLGNAVVGNGTGNGPNYAIFYEPGC